MKNILCYGDSNTFGFNPADGMRYSPSVRWPGKLALLLGDGYHVIEEGCNGRTTVFDDPAEGWKNGFDYLKPCLNSHKPVDIFVMMLGTNDLKTVFGADARMSAEGAKRLLDEVRTFTAVKQGFVPEMILVSPPVIGEDVCLGSFAGSFDCTAHERSLGFAQHFRRAALECGAAFLDASRYTRASQIDSLHLDREGHEALAQALCDVITH